MLNIQRFALFFYKVIGYAFIIGMAFYGHASYAYNFYLDSFNSSYGTAGSRLDNCGLCHFNFSGGGLRTPYGEDYRNNSYSITAIGSLDSDGDGFSNDQEAALSTLTMPGISCTNADSALNAPGNLKTFVDPGNPSCAAIGLPPVANANGPYLAVNGSPLTFSSAGSADQDGNIVSYHWNFGNGWGESADANPVFAYNVSFETKINIVLTVTDNDGNVSTANTHIIVLLSPNSPPVADAGLPVNGVVNSSVLFNGRNSSDADGDLIYYLWEFGDGSKSTAGEPSHVYTRCGTYDVNLTVRDIHFLTTSDVTTATIASSGVDAPFANAGGESGVYNGTAGSNITFDGSVSTDPDCNIVSYEWTFGDGTTGTGVNPVHSYNAAGNYVVTLTVTDNDGLTGSAAANVSVIEGAPVDGAALYETNCAACHGTGNASTKAGATVERINNGISNVASMNALNTLLSPTEIQAIADYLAALTPPPPPSSTDGAALYGSYCAACHGAGESSTKIGRTATQISSSITTIASMNSLSTLTVDEVQAIADYLASLTPPPPPSSTDGAALYGTYCATCHGAGDASTKIGRTASQISASITDITSMNSLSSLTTVEVQAIADYLASLTPPPPPSSTDGAALYGTYCATCHGAGDASTKIGRTATQINASITDIASMNSLSSLTTVEVQAIANYLASLTPPPPPTDGAGLYASYCAGCHGTGAATTKGGADVTRINNGINSVTSMNYLATTLSAADVQAIADYLSQFAPTSGGSSIPHEKSEDGVMHAAGNNYPFTNSCTTCHGNNLEGGIGPSCTSCHGVEWKESAPEPSGTTVPHTVNESGVYHAEGNNTPFSSGCTACHGVDLQGAIGPSCTSCHGVEWSETAPPVSSTDGSALYATYCAACHGADTSSTKIGATITRINNGISNVAVMNSLNTMPPGQRQTIADYLVGLQDTTPPPASSTTGEALYAANCASCHGSGSGTSKAGATVVSIVNAITGTTSVVDMQNLNSMTVADVQAISDYLVVLGGGATPPANDGTSLYATYCAACHGAGDASTKIGATLDRINTGISSVASMNSLSTLATDQRQAIADYLVSLAPTIPQTGEELYAANCSGCHGAGSATTKGGADVTRINDGISAIASMNYLSTALSAADVQLIADYLAQFTPVATGPIEVAHSDSQDGFMHAAGKNQPYTNGCSSCHGASLQGAYGPSCSTCHGNEWNQSPPSSSDGATLYKAYCEGCHGVDSESSKVGASVLRINNGIANEALMSSLDALTNTQVQGISDYLLSLSPPPTTGGGTGTGESLYAGYCASCHGSGASTTKGGADANRINNGIVSVASMNSLATLSAADVQAIADYLAQFAPSSNAPAVAHNVNESGVYHASGNNYPYTNSCTTCHGASLQGDIAPSCYSCHGQEWNESAPSQ